MRKKRGHPEQGDKLNQDLCPEEFEICVPKACKLFGKWDGEPAWKEYLKTLIPDGMPPEHYEPIPCFSCDCKPGWSLRGELAIAHACKVLDKIQRQALSLEQVSAVDVGFLIWERKGEFGNFLAIRIHVNKKRPPEQLARMGLESFTRAAFAFADIGPPGPVLREGGRPYNLDSKCFQSERWIHLMELLEREFAEDKDLWKGIGRYPIGGVSEDDLSIFCPRPIAETRTLADIRLCICGVPIDVVNAEYNPTVTHPGGDADKGVFVRRPRRSNRLGNEEQLLIGRGRVNPLVGGVSVGSVSQQAGTLATIVWDRTDGTPCVLGNWHVLAGATPRVDQPVYQPAIFDGGTEGDVVAYLKRWHIGEEGDAAIAELSDNRCYASGEVLGLWHPISGYLPPRLNLEVRKWGRTTGFTQGFIDGIHLATNIDYGNGVVRSFRDQFHVAPLCPGEDVSQVGDSGSLVVTSLKPVELQEDLATLVGWLRDCSGQARRALCDEMRGTLECLIEECKQLESPSEINCTGLCKILETALRSILAVCGEDTASTKDEGNASAEDEAPKYTDGVPGLCDVIEDEIANLDRKYWILRELAASLARLATWLQHIYEKYCNCNPDETAARKKLRAIAEDLRESYSNGSKRQEVLTRLEDLALKKLRQRNITCRQLAELLEKTEIEAREARKCRSFCGIAIEYFEQWRARCCRILEGEGRCEDICEILKLEDKCRFSACTDPAAVVDCIEKELEKKWTPKHKAKMKEFEKKRDHADRGASQQEEGRGAGIDPDDLMKALKDLLANRTDELVDALRDSAETFRQRRKDKRDQEATRAYYAVGMIFAGDTPGSPFGEFAVASEISRLERELRFSLRPVFEPRSSFRELRERPPRRGRGGGTLRSGSGLSPGEQSADPRGGGPQPDLEPAQSSAGSGPGSGSGGG